VTTGRVGGGGSEELNWVRATDDPDPDAVCMEIAAGEGDLVHIRQSDAPDRVVTTTQAKWDAFVLGVRNSEFDHFVSGHPAEPGP
jgi:predicted secreted Zn-dependent protease